MRFFVLALMFSLSAGIVLADDFYGAANPFAGQVSPQKFNNIYETEPSATIKEKATEKKMWFWNKSKNKDAQTIPQVNEGIINDGSFYVFPPQN